MYRVNKHNAADVLSRWPDYASEVEENSCLSTLQSKLKAMRIITLESLKSLKGKPNEVNCAECVSSMTTLVGCKLAIQDVTHFKKGCTPSSSVGPLALLFRRLIVVTAARNPQ